MGLQAGETAATIGFFDGVHQGHVYLLNQLRQTAAEHGLRSMAITFDRHPRTLFHPERRTALLTPLSDKVELLRRYADEVHVLTFDRPMAALTARAFMDQVLYRELHVRLLMLGYDHRFGSDQLTSFEAYQELGRQTGIQVFRTSEYRSDAGAVSSSSIRTLISQGQIRPAAQKLGHPYRLRGTVVGGQQIGRQLGYPTANILPLCPDQLIPANGVYAADITDGDAHVHRAMLNIGNRPTISTSNHQQTIEAHLIHYDGNLYGHTLTIDFIDRLRDEQRFDSLDQLRQQLEHDCIAAEQAGTLSHHSEKSHIN